MKISMDSTLHKQFHLGLIHYNKITVGSSPQMVAGRLRLFQEQLFFELEGQELLATRFEPFKATAFYQTIQQIQQEIFSPLTNSAEDLTLLFALQFSCPVLILPIESAETDLIIDETFIQTKQPSFPSKETNAVQLFLFPKTINKEACNKRLESAQQFFIQIHGGEGKYQSVNELQTFNIH